MFITNNFCKITKESHCNICYKNKVTQLNNSPKILVTLKSLNVNNLSYTSKNIS